MYEQIAVADDGGDGYEIHFAARAEPASRAAAPAARGAPLRRFPGNIRLPLRNAGRVRSDSPSFSDASSSSPAVQEDSPQPRRRQPQPQRQRQRSPSPFDPEAVLGAADNEENKEEEEKEDEKEQEDDGDVRIAPEDVVMAPAIEDDEEHPLRALQRRLLPPPPGGAAAAAGAPQPDAFEDFRPSRLPSDAWRETVFQPTSAHGREWCFFCSASQDPWQYQKHMEYKCLWQLVEEHYRKMHPLDFARMLQAEYNTKVRRYVKEGGKDWSIQCILEHLATVRVNPMLMYTDEARVLTDCMGVIAQAGLGMQRGGGAGGGAPLRSINSKNMELYLKIGKRRDCVLARLASYPDSSNL